MAFNIWERWPWTSFQNLNLNWLMNAVKEAITKAEEASASVGQFDALITANTEAIAQLGINVSTLSSPVHVLVSSELEARYRGNLVTGAQLFAMMQTHGDLPYVEYNGEVYMLDSVSSAGDIRFSMAHTTLLGDVTLRHIMIPAQSSNVAYSITNIDGGGSGSSGNVFAVTISQQASAYVSDHTYAEIYSQLQAGRIPVLLVAQGSNPTTYQICGMGETGTRTLNDQSVACIRFSDPAWMVSSSNNVGVWTIDANNNVDHIATLKQMATLDTVYDNAVIYTGPQELTAAEQAQAQENLGISGGASSNAVLYTAQTLTDQQKAQARANIGADIEPLVVTVANPSTSNPNYTVDKTAEEIRNNLYNLRIRFGLNEGIVADSYIVLGSYPTHNIVCTVSDPSASSVTYTEFTLQFYYDASAAPTPADDVVTVTYRSITHNIGGGSLPDTTNAAAGDFLRLDAQKNVVWATVPAAESNSFGGVS